VSQYPDKRGDPITRTPIVSRGSRRIFRSLMALWVGVFLAATASDSAHAACDPAFVQVNEDGFGDAANHYAWAMKVFQGLLYVSTYNPTYGGEIWRYDGADWDQVVSGGLNTSSNVGARNLIIFQEALYGGIRNTATGAQLWRSTDGVNWTVAAEGGFGNPQNTSVRGMAVFNDYLFIGVQNTAGGPGQLFRSSNGINFEPVTLNAFGSLGNDSIHVLTVFRGQLYAGTRNISNGLEIWRSSDGFNFVPVVGPGAATSSGFGVSGNIQVYDLKEFNGFMYVGLANLQGYRVYRTYNGTNYRQVLRSSNRYEIWSWKFGVYENHLWLGTFNVLTMLYARPIQGGSVLRSPDGLNWETMVGQGSSYASQGFDDRANWGLRTFESYQPPGALRPRLYIGTANCWNNCGGNGAEVWEWPGEACPE
jgi:hypothetical protein